MVDQRSTQDRQRSVFYMGFATTPTPSNNCRFRSCDFIKISLDETTPDLGFYSASGQVNQEGPGTRSAISSSLIYNFIQKCSGFRGER